MTPPPLLNINDVAARLNVNVRHVRRLVAERRIPYLKWGHLLRFDSDELDRWVEAARVATAVDTLGCSRGPTAAARFSPHRPASPAGDNLPRRTS